MKALVLSERAVNSLEDIIFWRRVHFGDRQARLYRDELLAKCRAVAGGMPGRPLRLLLGDDAPGDTFFSSSGSHYIAFTSDAEKTFVVDVIHRSRDLALALRLSEARDEDLDPP